MCCCSLCDLDLSSSSSTNGFPIVVKPGSFSLFITLLYPHDRYLEKIICRITKFIEFKSYSILVHSCTLTRWKQNRKFIKNASWNIMNMVVWTWILTIQYWFFLLKEKANMTKFIYGGCYKVAALSSFACWCLVHYSEICNY